MEKFHSDKNVFITSTEELDSADVEEYILENMKNFPKPENFPKFSNFFQKSQTFSKNLRIHKLQTL